MRCNAFPKQLGVLDRSIFCHLPLMLWAVYCALLGNADAHGKNISLTGDTTSGLTLTPWYDLVPTIAYPESLVDRVPAMAIGNAKRIDQIDAGDWSQFASEMGWRNETVALRVQEIGENMLACITGLLDELEQEGANGERLSRQVKPVIANIQRTLKHQLTRSS
jgi:serine/threonine-protein kinase HipA